MSKLRGYHCNICGAWLLIGEKHSCDIERLHMIDRIADFFSHSHHHENEEELAARLNQLKAIARLDKPDDCDDDEDQ
jgi:hypothetical protein